MELEKNTFLALIEYLKNHGYPDSSFAVEYNFGKFRVDLAVIDSDTNNPIQIYEIKSEKNQKIKEFGEKHLKKVISEIGYEIPSFLVYPKNSEPYFFAERVSFKAEERDLLSDEKMQNRFKSFSNYQWQKQTQNSEYQKKKEKKVKNVKDYFKWLCWIFAFILISMVILIKIELLKIKFDTNELIILGFAIALVFFPFASKIDAFGISIDRSKANKSNLRRREKGTDNINT